MASGKIKAVFTFEKPDNPYFNKLPEFFICYITIKINTLNEAYKWKI
jgi:hypothetical protein